jgi:SAM-dependent methyltransferase
VFADTGSKNDLDCNLTELRVAADATNNNPDENDQANSIGFTRHTDSWGHLLRYYYAGKMITKLEPSHILDVGCGELQLPWFLNKNRFKPVANTQYVGIELRGQAKWLQADEEGKHKYRYKAHMTLVRGDIVRDDFSQTPGWASGGFPLVIFLEALEHFPREYAPVAMQRLFNWTKPGGVCLFSTPNAGVSVSTAENHTGPDGVSREWSYKDKIAMVQAAGFEIVETFGTFTGMSYMPAEVQEFVKTDPIWSKMKRFYDPTLFCSVIATAYPEHSNNSIFHLRRPA